MSAVLNLREQLHHIADELPSDATWDDVAYQVELHASIARGLADLKAGRAVDVEELLKEFQTQ